MNIDVDDITTTPNTTPNTTPATWVQHNDTICWGRGAATYTGVGPRIIFKRTERNVSVMWIISMRVSMVRAYPQLAKYYLAMSYTGVINGIGACRICSRVCNCIGVFGTSPYVCDGAATNQNQVYLCARCADEIANIHETALDITRDTMIVGDGGIIDVVVAVENIIYFFHRVSLPVSDFHYPNLIQCHNSPRCKLCSALEEICGKFAMSTGRKMFIDANWKKVRLAREIGGVPREIIGVIIDLFIQCMSG